MTQGHLRVGRAKEENRPVSNKKDAPNCSRQLLIHSVGPYLEPRTRNATWDPYLGLNFYVSGQSVGEGNQMP